MTETAKPRWRIALEKGHEPGKGPAARLLAASPDYNPRFWNRDTVRLTTNCYAYAADDPLGHQDEPHTPQPGQATGERSREDADSVVEGAVRDGMVSLGMEPKYREGYYLVALAIDPGSCEGWDYHWYRLGKDGYWTHKPGTDPVTNLDSSGERITCPERCDRGRYAVFHGYFLVPAGGLKVGASAKAPRERTPTPPPSRLNKLRERIFSP
jgi:hypothetical protein